MTRRGERASARRLGATIVLFAAVLTAPAAAQCSNVWSPGPVPGVVGLGVATPVRALASWDRDGAGPLPPQIVVAGEFTTAGAVLARRIAAVDLATASWSSFGTGLDGEVAALAVLPNGDLVAGGAFTDAGGAAASRVARWDGTAWHALAAGLSAAPTALAVLPNGDLVAAGPAIGGPLHNVMRWDGVSWSSLGFGNGAVSALAVLPNAELVAGGTFAFAGGVQAANVARWNGGAWAPLGFGTNGAVAALAVAPNGDLVAGGSFSLAGSVLASRVASWNGVAWSALGSGLLGNVRSVAVCANGDVVLGIDNDLLRWAGASWTTLRLPGDSVLAVHTLLALPAGDVIVGGAFTRLGGVALANVARWHPAGGATGIAPPAVNTRVLALAALPDGSVIAGGMFSSPSPAIARWGAGAWSSYGTGLGGYVNAVGVRQNGEVIAGGSLLTAVTSATDSAMRWTGSAWLPMGVAGGAVRALVTMPNGDVVAGGTFTSAGGVPVNRIARWNGITWSPLAAGILGPPSIGGPAVHALAVLPNGDLIAGGFFSGAGGVAAESIARWDGTSWHALGSGVNGGGGFAPVNALAALPNGDVVAGGLFGSVGGVSVNSIARWNGAVWSPLGAGPGPISGAVNALAVLPGGDLVAGGQFPNVGGGYAAPLWRWNGVAWSSIASSGTVYALAMSPRGVLAAGGDFLPSGVAGAHYAELSTTCPATAVVAGAGCSGSAGPCVLTATTLPWLGATFRARATGVPPSSFALVASGVTPAAMPLAVLLPQGLPGCTAWVIGDLLDVVLPIAGAADTQVALPSSPALVGATFQQQVLPFVFDASGALVELTSTNSLLLTLGAF
jgi:hypothetical protein